MSLVLGYIPHSNWSFMQWGHGFFFWSGFIMSLVRVCDKILLKFLNMF